MLGIAWASCHSSSILDSLLHLYNQEFCHLPPLLPESLDGTPQIYPNLRYFQLHLTWTQLFSPGATLQPSGSQCLWPKRSPSEVGGPVETTIVDRESYLLSNLGRPKYVIKGQASLAAQTQILTSEALMSITSRQFQNCIGQCDAVPPLRPLSESRSVPSSSHPSKAPMVQGDVASWHL